MAKMRIGVWQSIKAVILGLLCLAIVGFAGYGVYSVVQDVSANIEQTEEETQTPETENGETTPEEEIATTMVENHVA